MELEKKEAVDLFVAMGILSARDWPLDKLQAKAQKVKDLMEPGAEFKDPRVRALFDKVVAAKDAGEEVTVKPPPKVGDKAAKKPTLPEKKAAKPGSNGKPKDEVPRDRAKMTDAQKLAAKKAAVVPPGPKPGGVIFKIVELLKAASKTNPIKKKDLLDTLEREFPDRKRLSMANTVGAQLSCQIERAYGLKVSKSPDGYWIGAGQKVTKPAKK